MHYIARRRLVFAVEPTASDDVMRRLRGRWGVLALPDFGDVVIHLSTVLVDTPGHIIIYIIYYA